ncbi:hypothetical protein Ahy_A02g005987 [Arachis hypogaea]|uniref:Uncharacterized protein n=1 Tax=Arachis hypogaea TaxID=3818 RepID=A0A445E8B8_ARAHY|nr:hypothetical protein Ahy_A02g005987 [Arachis hypogaea]
MYKKLSLPHGQSDIQLVIATTQLQEKNSTNRVIYSRTKWSMHEGVTLLLANLILFPSILDEETLEELPTPTIVHERSLLDLTNSLSSLLYSFSGIFRCFFLSLRKSEPLVHIQETIIITRTIRHLTHNHNDLIARAELYQLSYILPSHLDHPRLELETSLVKANLILFPRIPDKKTLEVPPTPTIVHVRSLLNLTNYVSYRLYVIDSLSLSQ